MNDTIQTQLRDDCFYVSLNRPSVRNALNADMILALTHTFQTIPATCRLVVLQGVGEVFCSGADINWMQEAALLNAQDNRHDVEKLSALFLALSNVEKPVLAKVQGAAIGGGAGLLTCCDLVVAERDAVFAFSEVHIGLLPAVIAPYVLANMGLSRTRQYFLLGQKFSAQEACQAGLVTQVSDKSDIDQVLENWLQALLQGSPSAEKEIKSLLRFLVHPNDETVIHARCADAIARQRQSPDGQEGLLAYLEKRKPQWQYPSR